MKIKATYNFKIPTHLLSALVNSDYSGLDDDDFAALHLANEQFDELVICHSGETYTMDFDDEEYFTWSPDFIGLGCNVVDMKLHIF